MKTKFDGVSVLTKGEARGHGAMIDEQTLAGVMQLLDGQAVKSYLTHAGAPADRTGNEIGILEKFRRDGEQVRADLTLLAAFVKADSRTAETIAELAERAPDALGLSLVGAVRKAWLTRVGEDVPAEGEFATKAPPDAVESLPALRFDKILSCDVVGAPAANVGLFAALSEKLAERDEQIVTLTAERDQLLVELSRLRDAATEINVLREKVLALAGRLEQAELYDMRKAGAAPIRLSLGNPLTAHHASPAVPDAGATDQARWAHYCELQKTSPQQAEAYRRTHLSRSR